MISNIDPTFLTSKISQSELYAFLRCKKQWQYSYVQGIVPLITPDYLTKGSFLHKMMADYLNSIKDGTVLDLLTHSTTLQRESLINQEATVNEITRQEIVTQLKAFWEEVGTDGFDVVSVEEEFLVDLSLSNDGKIYPLHGFIDAVVRDKESGNLWVIEHKTAARAWSTSQFEFAYQGKLYCNAWEALTGERPVGIQYNFFYPKRFEIRTQYVSVEEAQLLRDELATIVALRNAALQAQAFPREPLWGCNGCQFRDLCFAQLVGADDSHLLMNQYRVDEDRKERYAEYE